MDSSSGARDPTAVRTAGLDASARTLARTLLRHGPLARTELARRLELSGPTVTRLTRTLLRTGLIREHRIERRRGTGRPRQPLEIDPDAARFVGIKLVAGAAYGVLTDLAGTVLRRRRIAIRARIPGTVLARVAGLIQDLATDVDDLTGVGIGIGGPVSDGRTVRLAPFLGWGEVDVGGIVSAAVARRVSVHNDVKALTLGLHWFGAGRDHRSLAVIIIGVGVGCALVINDDLITTDHGLSGEVGHWQLLPDGPLCDSHPGDQQVSGGRHRGCPSSIMSSRALARNASEAIGARLTFDQVIGLARDGDPIVLTVLEGAAYQLGVLCARVADLVAPTKIIVCGDGVDLALVGAEAVRAGLSEHRTQLAEPRPEELIMERLDFFDWARGGAALAIRNYLAGG